ncbi:hypothetical protein D3C77_496810 [compost metagenome]
MIVFQPAFNEVDVFSDVIFIPGLVGEEGFHHVLGHARPHQPRQVGFDAITQTAQRIRAALVKGQVEIAQGLLHFLLRSLCPQGLGQLRGKLLW